MSRSTAKTHTRRRRGDDGTAILEFVFIAVVVMVPLVYLSTAVAVVQRTQLGVANAARDVGRAFATSHTSAEAPHRAEAALRIALGGQGPADAAILRYVSVGYPCSAVPITPAVVPGGQFTVCVTRRVNLPGVPSVLVGRGVTCVGRYTVRIDDYRTIRP